MTDSEKQIIIDTVISALRTNSRTIEQLTPVAGLSPDDCFEINGGRRIAYSALEALFKDISAKDKEGLRTAIDLKELRRVYIDISGDSATLTIESAGKTIRCSMPVATPGGFATLDNGGKIPDNQMAEKYRWTAASYASSWKRYLETDGVDYSESWVSLGDRHTGSDDDIEVVPVDIQAATHERAGVMSAEDKRKLDSIVSSPETVSALTVNEVVILTDINP